MKLYIPVILFLIVGSILSGCEEKDIHEEPLPYLGHEGKDHIIPPIKFLNQDSIWVTSDSFAGKIWIAEFFFSTCPSICPIMNSQMNSLVKEFQSQDSIIQFLSFSINPLFDTPSVLKNYAHDNGYNYSNWDFLTGLPESFVHELGVNWFLVHAGKGDEDEGGYAHSGAFTLVDEQGHVRGVYQITDGEGNKDLNEFNRLRKDLKILLKYEYGV